MYKRFVSLLMAVFMVTFSALAGITYSLQAADSTAGNVSYEFSSKEVKTFTGADNKVYNVVNTVPTISNPKGIFLRVKHSTVSTTINYASGLDYQIPLNSDNNYNIGNGTNVTSRILVTLNGQVATTVKGRIPKDFEGYVFVPASPSTNGDLDLTKVSKIAIWMHTWTGAASWVDSTLVVTGCGFYSVANSTDTSQFTTIVNEAEKPVPSNVSYEFSSKEVKSFTGSDNKVCDVVNTVPKISNPKGIFLRVKHSTVSTSINYASGLDYQIPLNSDNTYNIGNGTNATSRVLVTLSGQVVTTVKGRIPKGFEGYVFVPASPSTNGDLDLTKVSKIAIWMNNWSGAASWVDSTLEISACGFYSVSSSTDSNQYIEIVNKAETPEPVVSVNYEFSSKAIKSFPGSDNKVCDVVNTVPTIANPKGIFLRVKHSTVSTTINYASGLDYQIPLNSDNSYNIGNGTNATSRVLVTLSGQVVTTVKGRIPKDFEGYVFVPASPSTNGDLDLTKVSKIAIWMHNWTGAASWVDSTLEISGCGFYSVSSSTDSNQYIEIVNKAETPVNITYNYQFLKKESVTITPPSEAYIGYVTKTVPSPTIENVKGIFMKIKMTGTTDKLNYQIPLNSDNTYNIGNGANESKRVYVSMDGTVTKGRIPVGFEGYVFIPADAVGNGNLDTSKVTQVAIWSNNWNGAPSWIGSSIEVKNTGYYSVSAYDGETQYISLVQKMETPVEIAHSYNEFFTGELLINSSQNSYIAYVKKNIPQPEIANPKGIYFRLKMKNMTDVLDYQLALGQDSSGTNSYNIGNGNNSSKRIYVGLDGTVTRGYIPVGFDGYVFVPADGINNTNLDITKIVNLGIWVNNWMGKGSWIGVEALVTTAGYYSVGEYGGDTQYIDLAGKAEEEYQSKIPSGPVTYSYEIVNDFETEALRNLCKPQAGNSDIGGSYTGKSALSGNGSGAFLINNKDNSRNNLISPTPKPKSTATGIFFRFKTTAKKNTNFMISMGEKAPYYEIGQGKSKIFISMDGKVSRGALPCDNFDGYVFIPADPVGNTPMDASKIYRIAIWFNAWDTGVLWFGSSNFVDNVGYYNTSRISGDEQYLSIVNEVKVKYGSNSFPDMYFTAETSPLPVDTLAGSPGLKPLIYINMPDSYSNKEIAWSVKEGNATLKTADIAEQEKQGCYVMFSKGGTVVIRASLKADSSKYTDLVFTVEAETGELEGLLNEAYYIENIYSESAWNNFMSVVNAAEALLSEDSPKQHEVDQMCIKLKNAIDVIKNSSPKTDSGNSYLTSEKVEKLINDSDSSMIKIKLTGTGIVTKEILEKLKETGKSVRFEIYDKDGLLISYWEFTSIDNTDNDLNLAFNTKSPYASKIGKLINYNSKSQYLSFKNSTVLPGAVKIVFQNTRALKASDNVILYRYDADKNTLSKLDTKVLISNDGKYISLTTEKAGEYLISAYTLTKTEVKQTTSKNNWLILIIIIVSVILLAGAATAAVVIFRKKENHNEN